MDFLFMASMEKKKSEDKSICHPSTFSIIPLSSRNAVKRSTIQLPPNNKGYINSVFCRNWVVRSPAGTRLDSSSLVKKTSWPYCTLHSVLYTTEYCTLLYTLRPGERPLQL
jgi:hypothetical protein